MQIYAKTLSNIFKDFVMEKDPWCPAGFKPIYNVAVDCLAFESIMKPHLFLPYNILLHHKRYGAFKMYKIMFMEEKYWFYSI